jgi:hypothetical protein
MASPRPELVTPPLTVADVMARYRLRDRRAARRLMDAAGAFRMGANLFVRLDDLLALEDRQIASRRAQVTADPSSAPSPSSPRAPRPLEPGWWRREPLDHARRR